MNRINIVIAVSCQMSNFSALPWQQVNSNPSQVRTKDYKIGFCCFSVMEQEQRLVGLD
jgi:hypothetical protein